MAAAVLIAPAAAQQTDWTKRVTLSPMGGHVMGNPLAKNRLVEYVSYTCSHCADFEVASNTPLKSQFVAKGRVSAEVRNYVRDGRSRPGQSAGQKPPGGICQLHLQPLRGF